MTVLVFFNASLTEIVFSLSWMHRLMRARAITRTVSHQNLPQSRRYYLAGATNLPF